MKGIVILLFGAIFSVSASAQSLIDLQSIHSGFLDKYIFLCQGDSLLDEASKDHLRGVFRSRLILEGDVFSYEKQISDTSTLFLAVLQPKDSTKAQLHLFKGGRSAKSYFEKEPLLDSVPKNFKSLAMIQFDKEKLFTTFDRVLVMSMKDMVNWGRNLDGYEDLTERIEHLEWFETDYRVFLDSMDLGVRTQRIGLSQAGFQRAVFSDSLSFERLIVNPKSKSLYLDRQEVTKGTQTIYVWYLYDLRRGLVFYAEEAPIKNGKRYISDEYLQYLFQENQLLPGKHPKVAGRTIYEPVRQ